MPDVWKFVDSIASSPTTRLDINNESNGWAVRNANTPPPRLRRAVAANAMRDGLSVSTSQYDARVLTLELELIRNDQDTAATELQKLARELDRTTNILMYQPTGATKPVFFRTFRSDFAQLADVIAQKAMRRFTIELLAEPFALGLRETLGPFTVTNNPATGSNPCYFDVTGVIGDVPAPAVWIDADATWNPQALWIGVRQDGTHADLVNFKQAEDASNVLRTDTTNPGGGPDAALSGTGTNNYVRCTFASATAMTERISLAHWLSASATTAQRRALRGRYRLLAAVRKTATGSTMTVRARYDGGPSNPPAVTLADFTGRQIVDLGIVNFGDSDVRLGYESTVLPTETNTHFVYIDAARTSGSGSLDFDVFMLQPADAASAVVSTVTTTPTGVVLDAINDRYVSYIDGSPAAGTAETYDGDTQVAGSLPLLAPGVTNRVFYQSQAGVSVIDRTSTVTLWYWPQYLYVRPVSS